MTKENLVDIRAERDRLKVVNKELVYALEEATDFAEWEGIDVTPWRAALTKAEEKQI